MRGRSAVGDETARRMRLDAVERELVRLAAQYELAMSAFKFDEAAEVQRQVAALDRERRTLAAELPPQGRTAEPPVGVVPALSRPRRRRR